MKKFILTAMAVCAMMFSTTSCLENVEPAGIEDLRNAKAELVRAEAAYRTAEIEYLNARIAYENAVTEGIALENDMKELELQAKELELQNMAALYEYEAALRELELTRLEFEMEQERLMAEIANGLSEKEAEVRLAEMEYQLAQIEQQVLALEVEMTRREIEQLQLEQEKERMIAEHEANMLYLQEQLLLAEASLAQTIRDIEAIAGQLSPEEQARIQEYLNNLDRLSPELRNLESQIFYAQQNLISSKFDFDSVKIARGLERDIDNAEKTLEEAKADLELAKAIDLDAEISEFQADIDAIDAELLTIADRRYEIEMELFNETEELQPYQDSIDKYNERRNIEIPAEISELQTKANNLEDEKLENRGTIEWTMSDNIAHLAAQGGLRSLATTTDGTVQVLKGFEYEEVQTVYGYTEYRYYLPEGAFAWTATDKYNLDGDPWGIGFTGLGDVLSNLRGFVLNSITEVDYQREFERLSEDYAEAKKFFEDNTKKLNQGYDDYVLNYNKYTEDAAQKALEDVEGAIDVYEAVVGTPTTEDQTKVVSAIYKVRDAFVARKALDNVYWNADVNTALRTSTVDQLKDKLFGATPSLTLAEVDYEVQYLLNNVPAEASNLIPNNYGYYEPVTGVDVEESDKSAMQRWNEASLANYLVEYADKVFTLTPDFMDYGTEWTYTYLVDWISDDYIQYFGEATVLNSIASEFGYPNDFQNDYATYPFLNYLFLNEKIQVYKANIDFQPELLTLIDKVEAEVDRLNDLTATLMPEKLAIYEQIRLLNEEIIAIGDKVTEVEEARDSVVAEYDLLRDEYNRLDSRQVRLENLRYTIVNYIDAALDEATEGEVNYYDYFVEQYEYWIENLEAQIEAAAEDLYDAERELEKLVSGLMTQQQLIEQDEFALKQLQEEYDLLLEEFNKWSKMLKDYLASLNGTGEAA